ncbi:MAG: GTPase ObgE [Acidobacteriota bacterium]
MFVDEVDIHVAAGHGGAGALAFRREKFIPRGGPSGGDGGHGGSIHLVANANLNTLLNYRFQKIFSAGRGSGGEGSNRSGKKGADIELQVPTGTVVYEKTQDGDYVQVADLTEDGQRVLLAQGGLGGHGNASFATSTNRAPRRTQPGLPGEEKDLRFHLKLLADVGLVGFPNAGKSTMIARISSARPKIADYPFTTLVPNLGVVGLSGDRSFVVADVPGLIEGAHAGHGLGHRFLSHLERTKVLVHLVDVSSSSGRDPVSDYDIIIRELELFPGRDASGERLAQKPILAAANKIDALDDPDRLARLQEHLDRLGVPLFKVSAATGEAIPALLEAMWQKVAASHARAEATAPARPPKETSLPAAFPVADAPVVREAVTARTESADRAEPVRSAGRFEPQEFSDAGTGPGRTMATKRAGNTTPKKPSSKIVAARAARKATAKKRPGNTTPE